MTAINEIAKILMKLSFFLQNIRFLIAAKSASTFCWLKTNNTTIYCYVKIKK